MSKYYLGPLQCSVSNYLRQRKINDINKPRSGQKWWKPASLVISWLWVSLQLSNSSTQTFTLFDHLNDKCCICVWNVMTIWINFIIFVPTHQYHRQSYNNVISFSSGLLSYLSLAVQANQFFFFFTNTQETVSGTSVQNSSTQCLQLFSEWLLGHC